VNAARNEVAKMSLLAPFDGTISNVNVSVGEMASPGAPAVSMVSNSNYEIDTLVSEADIAKVAVGENAGVTLDTFGSGVNLTPSSRRSTRPKQSQMVSAPTGLNCNLSKRTAGSNPA